MSRTRCFLICEDDLHAEAVDQLIMEALRDRDLAQGNTWSGVFTNGEVFGVLWASPASGLFGSPITEENPEGDPDLVIVEEVITGEGEAAASDWSAVPPPEPSEGEF